MAAKKTAKPKPKAKPAGEHKCPQCSYTAKTKGAVTQHVNKVHAEDPLAKLNNAIPGGVRPGGQVTTTPLKAAPSGIPSIDYAIGIGGIARGAIAEIFGPSASGKTFTALTFSAYAQSVNQTAGYMNAEKAPMETFLPLVPGLDTEKLIYREPPVAGAKASKADRELWDGSGEATLEASRRYINSGEVDVWTVDSVHSLVSRTALGAPIGSKAARAALARLMGEAIPVIEHEIAQTNSLLIFVNHVKQVPGNAFGRDWSKPGGSALDYYASLQVEVRQGQPYYRVEDGRKIGHVVKVKITKNKVALPHAKAEYDLFYGTGQLKEDPRFVEPGVDLASSWMSVLKESETISWLGNKWCDPLGEVIGDGSEADVREALQDPTSSLSAMARDLVYPEKYRT